MQGPRLSSHYDRVVPDLALHLPPRPDDKAGHEPELHRDSTRSPATARPHPSRHASNGPNHPQDPPSPAYSPPSSVRDDVDAARRGPPRDPEDGGAPRASHSLDRVLGVLKRHAAFVGPGVIASVAYLDPGNWSTDLQAGSTNGYSHLFVVLLAGLMALMFQILATRLGCVSDEDFATHCRIALHNRPGRFKLWYRWGLLYPLYAFAEIGIVFTDLAELIGSAIAINLLIPAIPLWACVLLTATDVLLILLLFNQYPTRTVTRSMRMFELLIGVLVLVVLASFVALLIKVGPDWGDAFYGYIPSHGVVANGGIYIAVGIVGATVMPHAFFIGSKMACMRRIPPSAYGEDDPDVVVKDVDDAYYVPPVEVDKKLQDEDDTAVDELGDNIELRRTTAPSRNPWKRTVARFGRNVKDDGDDGTDSVPRPMFVPSLHLPQPLRLSAPSFAFLTSPSSTANATASTTRSGMDDMAITEESVAEQQDHARTTATEIKVDPQTNKRKTKRYPPEVQRPKPTLACVKAHLSHAVFDVAGSLLGFALVVNSSILILAAAVFYYGDGRSSNPDGEGISDLFDAYDLVKQYLGQGFAYLFAIALLAAGQSASLTVTLSGQIIGEGFLRWRTKPWKRRLITRCIGIIPSLAVSIAVGRQGIDTLLVASQVALSIVLTFVLIPLIIFTSEHRVMALPDKSYVAPPKAPASATPARSRLARLRSLLRTLNPIRRRRLPEGALATYANPPIVVYLCWMIWCLVGIANVYAMYSLAHGG